jgi:hypothetical protein
MTGKNFLSTNSNRPNLKDCNAATQSIHNKEEEKEGNERQHYGKQ